MNHTLTSADVLRIHQAELAYEVTPGVKKTATEARQGTRTLVHELLQEQCPLPVLLPPPSRDFAPHEVVARDAETATRKVAVALQVSDADILESEKARSGPDGNHRDAVHYVQKKHGKALWAETDRLVNEALGGAA
jgi:hypothetical protein